MMRKIGRAGAACLAGALALVFTMSCGAAQQAARGNAAPARAQNAPGPGINGLWDAEVFLGTAEIPFRFEIETTGTRAQGFFFEGERKIGSNSGSFENGHLKLDWDFLYSTLDATLNGDEFYGTYGDHYPGDAPMQFRAKRFLPVSADATNVPQVAGNWEMRRLANEVSRPSDTRTWKLYLRQSGAEVSGSILRVDGDTGLLSGRWTGGTLVLSHFAGERPYLFEARLNPDGTLSITLNGGAHYFAARSSAAGAKGIPEPPDPTRYTSVKDPTQPFQFRFPDMNGKMVSSGDAEFQGKVVLVAIGGTWCPNCNDEAPFLAQLYKRFHAQGLEIVGLMFEADTDPALVRKHLTTFARRYGIEYPLLVPGTPDDLAQKLPELVNFGAYPTTIYLGRDGRVRSVHAGFASAATGAEHTRLEAEVTSLIEKLLAEGQPGRSAASSGGAF